MRVALVTRPAFGGSVLLGIALLAGCTFPSIQVVATDGADDATTADGSPNDVGDTSVDDVAVDDTGATADSRPTTDGGIDAGACASGNKCDCDGDGDNKPGPGCGGADCDDGDARRNSKVADYKDYALTGVTHGGDWNCNMVVEREHGNGGVSCGGLALGPCASTTGYKESMPACGTMATYVTCAVSGGVLCAEATSTKVVVKCK